MAFCLVSDLIYPALTDVTAEALRSRGITFLMMDFDNTIVPYTTDVPTEKMRAWIEAMKASGIGLCVVSNSKKPPRGDVLQDVWVRLRHARKKALSEGDFRVPREVSS